MSVSVPVVYNGMYLGNMQPSVADLLLSIRQTKSIKGLKHMVFDFPSELVMESLETQQSIRSIVKEREIDYTQYIGELKDCQTVGTGFMYYSPRSILADGVGMGKTVQISALLNLLHKRKEMTRFLMAVENSAITQTQCELIRFTGLNIIQLPSEGAKLKRVVNKTDWSKVDGIIIKHSTLRSDALSSWLALHVNDKGLCDIFDTFILDESSVIKNLTRKTAIYTTNISMLAKRVHFMNATVFDTSILDIYNQVEILNPLLLPKVSKIRAEYCDMNRETYWIKVKGVATQRYRFKLAKYKNQEKFKRSLGLFYFGRSRADVGEELSHVYKVYEIEPTHDQRQLLEEGHRHMEVLNCPSLIQGANIQTSRKTVPKIERLISLIENELQGEAIMIFMFHKEAQRVVCDTLNKLGYKAAILNGDTTQEKMDWTVQNDFNQGKYDIIITNKQKSLNLGRATTCIFYSFVATTSKADQTAGRITRGFGNAAKTFILLLYKGTPEYDQLTQVAKQRSKDSKDLTIDAKNTIDRFLEALDNSDE